MFGSLGISFSSFGVDFELLGFEEDFFLEEIDFGRKFRIEEDDIVLNKPDSILVPFVISLIPLIDSEQEIK